MCKKVVGSFSCKDKMNEKIRQEVHLNRAFLSQTIPLAGPVQNDMTVLLLCRVTFVEKEPRVKYEFNIIALII